MAWPKQILLKDHKYSLKHHIIGWTAFLALAVILILQLTYPVDRALPNAKLGEQGVGGWQFNDIATKVNNDFTKAEVTLRLSKDKSITYPLASAGAQPDTELIRERLVNYPLWQRLLPLSILIKQPHVSAMPVYFTTDKLEQFAQQTSQQLSTEPQNAGLSIVDGEIVAEADVPGVSIDSAELRSKLANQLFGVSTVVIVPRSFIPAEKPISYFSQVRDQAHSLLEQKIVITIKDKEYSPTRTELAGWFEIGDEAGQTSLQLNEPAIKDYLNTLQSDTRIPSGRTNITVVNGRETARIEGESGEQIDTKALLNELKKGLLDEGDDRYVARFATIKPQVVINNTYTSSEAGLRAYISDQVNKNSVRIAVEQLNGGRWRAYGRADESTVSASTYKLFVALRVLDDIERGKLSWSDSILDTNVTGCFERMVVVSLNTCAETWIGNYGREKLNKYLWQKGFSRGTDFNNPIANHTTARDLTNFYKRVYDGSLMSSASRQVLLDSLNNHGYTRGIPAGSSGRVHNKVGYLWGYSNDSAVVYHPKGVYTIAVLTQGMSFSAIAEITREIERIMYP